MKGYMKTRPYYHQADCLEVSKDRAAFALFLEQGLGKTKVVLDNAAYLYDGRRIDALLVVAPNGVHANWVRRELPAHLCELTTRWLALEYRSGKTSTKWFQRAWRDLLAHDGLAVLAMNVEAFGAKSSKAARAAEVFLKARTCMMALDESSRIKGPRSKRTKILLRLGRLAPYRRILTGTPVTQSPFDLYTQMKFLDPTILDFSSYWVFTHHFGTFETEYAQRGGRTWKYETLQGHVRLDELRTLVAPHAYRRTKAECLDLPPKIYQVVPLDMTRGQARLYASMDETGVLEFDDFEVLAPLQITRLLRLQQITGGFVPRPSGAAPTDVTPGGVAIDGDNPKLKYMLDAIENDYRGKVIVWARFLFEINMIAKALRETFPDQRTVELHGGVTGAAREENIDRFQNDPECRFLVGQQQAGIGITLHAAETVFYYSNPFSYEQRYQSEDRAHRIGLRHPVVYVDLVMDGTVDERVREILASARAVADEVTGDRIRKGATT